MYSDKGNCFISKFEEVSSMLVKILDGRVKDSGSRTILEKLKATPDLTNGKVKKYYLVYFIGTYTPTNLNIQSHSDTHCNKHQYIPNDVLRCLLNYYILCKCLCLYKFIVL